MKTLLGRRARLLTMATGAIAATTFVTASLSASAAPVQLRPVAVNPLHADESISSTGLRAGQVKHVWLIMLENKSYDATFTGLNQNSYLWKTLPSQGALLTNYFGTGHYSMDNYLTLISGQAPEQDTQSDCSVENFDFGSNASIVANHNNRNYGQVASAANPAQPSGANAPNGTNGCTYPTAAPTLFNQLDAAGKTWKAYAQDLHNQTGREDAVCGGPGTATNDPTTNPRFMSASAAHPFPPDVVSFTGAQPNDQYVAKHFPFAWFHSLDGTVQPDGSTKPGLTTPAQGGTDCDSAHIANLDSTAKGSRTTGLYQDLQHESTTPAFSWITPDNCSDAHDAICKGNNLSGSFTAAGQPIYQQPIPDPESTTPKNYTGGLYASDLFLKYYVTMIEKSPAFKDGGLIDVTFDEGNPPFTYSGNSFNNANAYGPTENEKPDHTSSIEADAAGENLYGRNIHTEPTGVNSTLGTNLQGQQLYPGPGYNGFIDRPPVCTATTPARVPANCVPGIVEGGSGVTPGARTDKVAAGSAGTYVLDGSILADDTGRQVTDTTDPGSPIPPNTFVGTVSDTGPQLASSSTGSVIDGSFQLVDQSGTPVTPTGPVSSLTLSAEGAPGYLAPGQTVDPQYDATDATPGGGDSGSVLISPLIKPGTKTSTFYNHYSWLRTMEDIFQVSHGTDDAKLPAGTVSGGLDDRGHLGFAAQAGLAPFGRDIFNNVSRGPRR